MICPACFGKGDICMVMESDTAEQKKVIKCPVCRGEGEVSNEELKMVERSLERGGCICGCKSDFAWDFNPPWLDDLTLIMCSECGKVVDAVPRRSFRAFDGE
jgi:uncharacterized Zn finger protein